MYYRKLFRPISFFAAVVLETDVLATLLASEGKMPDDLALLLSLHAGGVVLAAFAFYGSFPPAYRRSAATFSALVIGFCAPVPLLGLLFVAGFSAMLGARRVARGKSHYLIWAARPPRPANPEREVPRVRQTALQTLHTEGKEARRQALLLLGLVEERKAVPILQRALQDDDEMVRLQSLSQLSRIIHQLHDAIQTMEDDVRRTQPRAPILLRLAEHYRELTALGLADAVARSSYLGRRIELLEQVLRLTPENHAAQHLLMRCWLEKNDVSQAKACLESLRAQGCSHASLLADEAEIHFRERNVRALIRALRDSQARQAPDPSLRSLHEFWLPSASHSQEAYAA